MQLNQFGITDIKGKVLNPDKGFRYDVQNVGAADLIAGDYVALKQVAGAKVICVEKATAESEVFGVVIYEAAKTNTYKTGEMLTVANDYTIITCEANGAITTGSKVDAVIGDAKVVTHTSGKVVGKALTPAAVAGDLIQVRVNLG